MLSSYKSGNNVSPAASVQSEPNMEDDITICSTDLSSTSVTDK